MTLLQFVLAYSIVALLLGTISLLSARARRAPLKLHVFLAAHVFWPVSCALIVAAGVSARFEAARSKSNGNP